MTVERITTRSPDGRRSDCDSCEDAEDMPETRRDVSLVNVAPDGVRLIFED